MNLVIPFDPATMSVPLPGPLAAESRRTAPETGLAPAAARNGPGSSSNGSHALAQAPVAADTLPDFLADLRNGLVVQQLQLPARPALLGGWLKQGDLGYLFAPRGAGKSWMSMLIARAVATGSPLGEWQAGEEALPVYYFDAEMNLPDVQARMHSVGLFIPRFELLSNEVVFKSRGHGINIASLVHQQALSATLTDGCLFIIDNLSTSQLGMAENDNDSFDAIRDWLLSLRHRRITVLIVHHAGRNGQMRGSSRREDMAHWILSLKEAGDPGQPAHRTTFSTEFTKCRNCTGAHSRPLLWTLDTSTTPLTLGCGSNEPQDVMLEHIRDGVKRASELAEILSLHPGTISKWAAKMARDGLIVIRGRDYMPVTGLEMP